MTNAALQLAQEGGGKSGLDLILPAPAELFWGIVCFVVVLVVLTRYAWPALRTSIEARENNIQGALEEAEKAKGEAHRLLDDYNKQLAEARSEANRVIEDARRQAEDVRREIIARAESDAEGIVERAQEQIQAERTRAVQELQGQIAELSIDLAEKVVGRSLDGAAQREFVDAYIREVAAMSGDGAEH